MGKISPGKRRYDSVMYPFYGVLVLSYYILLTTDVLPYEVSYDLSGAFVTLLLVTVLTAFCFSIKMRSSSPSHSHSKYLRRSLILSGQAPFPSFIFGAHALYNPDPSLTVLWYVLAFAAPALYVAGFYFAVVIRKSYVPPSPSPSSPAVGVPPDAFRVIKGMAQADRRVVFSEAASVLGITEGEVKRYLYTAVESGVIRGKTSADGLAFEIYDDVEAAIAGLIKIYEADESSDDVSHGDVKRG